MAFVLYFFVLLVAASSVLFALDWVNAPLRPPVPTERAHVVKSEAQTKAQRDQRIASRIAQQQPPATSGSAPADEARAPEPTAQAKPDSVPAPPPSVTATAPPPGVTAPPPNTRQQAKSAEDAPHAAAEQTQASQSATQAKREPAAAPEPVKQQQAASNSAASNHVSTENSSAGTVRESRKEHAYRSAPRRTATQVDKSRPASSQFERSQAQARLPPGGREQARERVPAWAIRGAEEAEREAAEHAQPRPSYRPFWEPEQGWHFPRPFFGGD